MDKFEKLVNQIMKECEADGEPVTKEEAEEMAKMEMGAKEIKRYEKAENPEPKEKKPKPRKVDENKKLLITAIAKCLEDTDISNIVVKNEAEISFTRLGDNYTVKLIKHRPGK